ncbi:MAG: HDIG domain-containing protein [Clostridiales bacterium]|nr:HDIG domain-containing protein [Clostridiales bacterium]
MEGRIDSFFKQLKELQDNDILILEQKLKNLSYYSNIELDNESYEILLKSNQQDLTQLQDNTKYLINQILNQRINEEQLDSKKEEISNFFGQLPSKNRLNQIGERITNDIIKPNLFYDEEETNKKRIEARNNIEDILIKKGTRIISKGQVVNSQQIELLKSYGLIKDHEGRDWKILVSYSVLIFLPLAVLYLYLRTFCPKVWTNNSMLLLLSINMLITLLITVGTSTISVYMIPIPACALIVSILADPRAAIVTNLFMSLIAGFVTDFNMTIVITLIFSGIAGSIIVSKTHHRSVVIYAGLTISLMNMISIAGFGMIGNVQPKVLIYDMSYGIIGGIFTSILTIGLLPFFESVFDIITPIKLLELSNPNHSLLRRLLIEAPGTYYHSILVGNLSEAAADDIGANALLCRVSSYYHDIGKLKRPYFFKENQLTKENPHDKISPNLSAMIITSHVQDGLEIAKKYKLPSKVMDIIAQHHGNTLVAYFYHKAINTLGENLVTEEKFRYSFPKPQTKEAAIVMLADSVEAYVRSLTEPTRDEMEKGVRRIIQDKIKDNQLNQCDLSLKDIEEVIKSFLKVLEGIFHDRIEYPENIKEITNGGVAKKEASI